jgi:transketolase
MRTAFIEQLIEEAKRDSSVFLIVGDLGFSVVEPFMELFPDRFLNAGVAEQNMTGLAAGLSTQGYNVFTYSIANFPTLRCLEQIRNDVCYHDANVKVVAVGGGYAYASLGASHHATEDLGIMRVLPNILVSAPGDPVEARTIVKQLVRHKGPAYLRLGKAGEPVVHSAGANFEIGEAIKLFDGEKGVILTTGSMLKYAFDHIKNNKLSYGLCSFPYVKPMDRETLIELSEKYDVFYTLEEHQRSGGFGSAVLETINDLYIEGLIKRIPRINRIAIPDKYITVAGSQDHLRKLGGLTLEDVIR